MQILSCCNKPIKNGSLWVLSDLKDFTARKLYIGKCSVCGSEAVTLIEKRISDNKVFVNKIEGIEAIKTIYREKKRKLVELPNIKEDNLYGWVYGINTQIKDKKGNVTKIRQYASDFKGNRTLRKELTV